MKLIDADKLIGALHGCTFMEGDDRKIVYAVIQKQPSAQRKGKWVNDIAYYDEDGCPCIVTRCNMCGEVSPISNFCPNCGARMVRE